MRIKTISSILLTIWGLNAFATPSIINNALDANTSDTTVITKLTTTNQSNSEITKQSQNTNKPIENISSEHHKRYHYKKKKHHQYTYDEVKPKLSPLISQKFDFQYIGNIGGALWALKEYDPRLDILDPLGQKKQMQVNIDLTNISIQDVIDVINQQANGFAHVIFDPIADSIRLAYDTRTDYGTNIASESQKWREGSNVKPVLGKDGLVMIPFGEQEAQVVCQPLELCDISLEPGEYITSKPLIGDDVEWSVFSATSMNGDGKSVRHLVLKPHSPGLSTSLMIPTNKRTYMIKLRSSDMGYVSRIAFYYPGEFNIDKDSVQQEQQNSNNVNGVSLNSTSSSQPSSISMQVNSFSNLDFNYQIDGDKDLKWYPLRVFSDGSHTYIQMPKDLHSTDAPTFNILGPDGKTPEIVNWDLVNNTYIIDKIFSKAEMVMGNSDSTVKRIVIVHTEPKKSWW